MLSDILEKKIKKAPHKALRAPTEQVTVFDHKLKNMAQRMLFIMHQCEGVGLAANQMGFTPSLFVYKDGTTNHVCVNPTFVNPDEDQTKTDGIEGCLSVPDQWLYVPRYDSVVLRYHNLAGKPLERKLEGYEARIVQHEIAHLNGELITDIGYKKPKDQKDHESTD